MVWTNGNVTYGTGSVASIGSTVILRVFWDRDAFPKRNPSNPGHSLVYYFTSIDLQESFFDLSISHLSLSHHFYLSIPLYLSLSFYFSSSPFLLTYFHRVRAFRHFSRIRHAFRSLSGTISEGGLP